MKPGERIALSGLLIAMLGGFSGAFLPQSMWKIILGIMIFGILICCIGFQRIKVPLGCHWGTET